MTSIHKLIWYGLALSLPLIAQSTLVGGKLVPDADSAYYLATSLLLTAVQIGQAAAFQTSLSTVSSYQFSRKTRSLIALAGASALALSLAFPDQSLALTCTTIALGILAGATFSISNACLLATGTEVKYFRRLFFRNALVLTLCVTCANTLPLDSAAAVCCAALIILFISMFDPTAATPEEATPASTPSRRYLISIATGVAASSLYRNDQNLVRAASEPSASFAQTHNTLLLGAAIQAGAGALLTSLVIPRVRATGNTERLRRLLDALSATTLIAAAIIGFISNNETLTIISASMILASNQWGSYKLHLQGRSLQVYAIGTGAFALLATLLASGIDPVFSYLLFAVATHVAISAFGFAKR